MAQRGLVRGTPLRTLALLLSNRPDLVHESTLAAPHLLPGLAAAGPSAGGSSSLMMPIGGLGTIPGVPGVLPGPQGSAGGGLGPSPLGLPQGSAGGVIGPGSLGLPGVRVPTPGLAAGGAVGGSASVFTPGGSSKRVSGTGFFSPAAVGAVGAGDVLLSQWRENLAIMASNRTAVDAEPIMQLGDRLLAQQGQVGVGWGGGWRAANAVPSWWHVLGIWTLKCHVPSGGQCILNGPFKSRLCNVHCRCLWWCPVWPYSPVAACTGD